MLPKRGGGVRMVVDYRKVNQRVVFDSYPVPSIDQAFEQFGGATVFSMLDLNMAYHQIPLSTRSQRITAFCTPFGLYEYSKLPMGISVGCQGLSRVMDELFADLKGKYVFNFIDDLVVYSSSPEEHKTHVREVLRRLQTAGFTLNPEKVMLGATEITYLGHLLSAKGVKVLPDRIVAIQNYPRPTTLRTLRRFLGMVGFYARFIPEFSKRVAVLHALKKKGVQVVWTSDHQTVFESLKQALCEAPVLQIPDFAKVFVLVTDASDLAVTAMLHQKVNGELAPISYYSRLLTGAERKYSTYEKECLAVLFGCDKCRVYLEHKEFELHCDNLALCWLLKRTKNVGRLGRWTLRLAPFKFRVKHTRGTDNVVADALSRMFEGIERDTPEEECVAVVQSLPLVYSSLAEHQEKDAFCNDIRSQIQTGKADGSNYQLHKGLLCYPPKGARTRRWLVLESLRLIVLKYFHDAVLSGHLGAFKTFRKTARTIYWPKMRKEIFDYVRQCDLCQRAKPAQDTHVGLHSASPIAEPMQRLFVDFFRPLTRSKRGNIAILVVVDGFSKFVTFFPVRRITAQIMCDCLERQYFPEYGTPVSVVTDNAKVFRSKQVKYMCFRWGINHITTTPYYPQGSLAERVNRNLKAALKIFHHNSQDAWDEDLPWLSVAFNTAVHESTNCTPDRLFLGREMKLPLDNRWDLSSLAGDSSDHNKQSFWTKAYESLKRARNRVAAKYNVSRRQHTYQVGDTVVYN
jgi:transposase InsO family protein